MNTLSNFQASLNLTPVQQLLLKKAMGTTQRDPILAAIDVGTNSIHMAVVQIQSDIPAFTIIERQKDTVRLGEMDSSGNLTVAAMDRAKASLGRCLEIARGQRADAIVAVATSAVREAKNGREFLTTIEEELGLAIDLISGNEEARRIYLGVLSVVDLSQQPNVIIDIGGGSTELILGNEQEPSFLSSTKVGAVRLTNEFVKSDPISNGDYRALKAYIRGMLERPTEEISVRLQSTGQPAQLIGTSGTIETLAAIHAYEKLGEVPNPLHGYELKLDDLRSIVSRLKKMDYAERLSVHGVNDRRAEIILAGALILREAMELINLDSVMICERALREGIIVDWMLSHQFIEDRLRFQGSARQRSVLLAAQKFEVDLESADRVAKFALSIFDQLKGILHRWDEPERELLWAAALLHNSGHFVSHDAHHKHSYYLVRHAGLLGYTELELETIANLARYHRKSAPKKKHENYRNLGSKYYREVVDQLNPILRLAVALDRRRIGAIQKVVCTVDEAQHALTLELFPTQPEDPCQLELWGLEQKRASFESYYGFKVYPALTAAKNYSPLTS